MVSVDPSGMDLSRSIPFRNPSRQQWQDLALSAILAVFAFYFAWELALGRPYGQIGAGNRIHWSPTMVARVSPPRHAPSFAADPCDA